MKIRPWNLHAHELIGLYVDVIDRRTGRVVFRGRVLDETMNSFLVLCNDGVRRRFLKKSWRFGFRLPSKEYVLVDGERLVGRPEDRVKRI